MKASQIESGKTVCLNPHFLDVWWKGNNYFPRDIKGKVLTVYSTESVIIHDANSGDSAPGLRVKFAAGAGSYTMEILGSGEHSLAVGARPELRRYKNILVFIGVGEVVAESDVEHCSCPNPKETTVVIGIEPIKVCKNCTKEMQ